MLDATRILTEFAHVDTSDIRKITRPDGSFVPILRLDDAKARAISSVEVSSG